MHDHQSVDEGDAVVAADISVRPSVAESHGRLPDANASAIADVRGGEGGTVRVEVAM